MRRLNGRWQIMAFVGRSPRSKRSWRMVREQYAEAIYYLPGSRHVWAVNEELIALDRARSLRVGM